jgi:DNA mismatch repair protein MutS
VSEELLDHIKCRTLFATHYHELAGMSNPRLANRSMEVQEREGEIIFLRKLREGAEEESYGLHVAHLAGLPEPVLIRAGRIMERLREARRGLNGPALQPPAGEDAPAKPSGVDERYERFIGDIMALNPDRMTPLEALNRIHIWKRLFGSNPASRTSRANRSAGEPSLFD